MEALNYAKSELALIEKDERGMQEMMNRDILQIIGIFSEQGHSGFSANYAIQVLERLLRFKPLTPLTGADDEWIEPDDRGVRKNKRCSSVFQEEEGTAYDIDGIVVTDNGGITWFKSKEFRKDVAFPYVPPIHPEKVYIEYTEDVPPGFTGDEYEIITDKPERIKALYAKKQKDFQE